MSAGPLDSGRPHLYSAGLAGVIDQYSTATPAGQPEFPIGTAFQGSFTLETDVLPLAGDASSAFFYDLLSDLQVSFGAGGALGSLTQSDRPMYEGFPYTSSAYFLNDFPTNGEPPTYYFDQANFATNLNSAPGDSPYAQRFFSLGGFSLEGTMFDEVPTLADFPLPVFPSTDYWNVSFGTTLFDETGAFVTQVSFGGAIREMSRVASVPEPGTAALMIAGLLGAGLLRPRTQPSH